MLNRFTNVALAASLLIFLPACGQKFVVKQKVGAITGRPIDLDETRAAWEDIKSGTATPEQREKYNDAVDKFVVKLAGKRMPEVNKKTMTLRTFRGNITVELDPGEKGELNLHDHDQLFVSDFTRIKRGFDNKSRAATDGVGAPIALRSPPSESDPFIAKEGLWRPGTAILEFNGGSDSAKLVIYDPLQREEIDVYGKSLPLDSDFTVPLAAGFAKRDRQLINLPAMLKYEKFENKLGLIRLTPFDPKKTPCLLVHGLKSSPATWTEALNKILDDPDLRGKYEFWNYGYPTGAPIPYSAMRLRQDIEKMHQFRAANGASDNDIIILAHSMGGLISKTLVQSSGDENWAKIFNMPVDELDLPKNEREILRKMFYFEPVPGVKRIAFIATPHGGSDLALNPVGKLASTLIDLPNQLISISAHLIAHADHDLTPLGQDFITNPPTSIDSLRPDSPMLGILNSMPLKPDVKYHSIIGNKKKGTPRDEGTDSIVPVLSASIEGVESEIIIEPATHSVHRSEGGIKEIMRILHLHLEE